VVEPAVGIASCVSGAQVTESEMDSSPHQPGSRPVATAEHLREESRNENASKWYIGPEGAVTLVMLSTGP
jgi:hypothetical protein